MAFGDLQRVRYPVNVLTPLVYYSGSVQPIGPMSLWINDLERGAIPLYDAKGGALDAGSALDSFAREELIVLKQDIVAVDILSEEARKQVPMMSNVAKVAIYTDRFVFSGSFPTSVETKIPDMLDGLKGEFFPVRAAQIYPLRPTRAPVFRTSELVLLNRRFVTSYHST